MTKFAFLFFILLSVVGTATAAAPSTFKLVEIVYVPEASYECLGVFTAPENRNAKGMATLSSFAEWSKSNTTTPGLSPTNGDFQVTIVIETVKSFPRSFPKVTLYEERGVAKFRYNPKDPTALYMLAGYEYVGPADCAVLENWGTLMANSRDALPKNARLLAGLIGSVEELEDKTEELASDQNKTSAEFKDKVEKIETEQRSIEENLAILNREVGPGSPLADLIGALSLRLLALEQGALTPELGDEIYLIVEESLINLREELEDLKGRVDGVEEAIVAINGRLKAIETRLSGLEARMEANEASDNGRDRELEELRKRLDRLEQQVNPPVPATGTP